MKHRFFCRLVIAILAVCSLFSPIALSKSNEVKVLVDGQKLEFPDQKPIVDKERTMVPMRIIFEHLGAAIEWNEDAQTIKAKTSDATIVLRVGSKLAAVNKDCIEMDVAPEVMNDRTMVPLRFVGETLGSEVKWDEKTQTVRITSKKAAATPVPKVEPK